MSTPLLHDFPELAHLSCAYRPADRNSCSLASSREDLEDLLADNQYFQAVFSSLPRVKAMHQSQSELGMANEAIARNNLALQESLYQLRSETKEAFDEAKMLENRWKELEKEQKDVYQRFTPQFLLMRLRHATTAQDEASESLAAAFVQQQPFAPPASSGVGTPNGREIEDFVKEFKDLRATYHKRVMWGDRWTNGQVTWRDD